MTLSIKNGELGPSRSQAAPARIGPRTSPMSPITFTIAIVTALRPLWAISPTKVGREVRNAEVPIETGIISRTKKITSLATGYSATKKEIVAKPPTITDFRPTRSARRPRNERPTANPILPAEEYRPVSCEVDLNWLDSL